MDKRIIVSKPVGAFLLMFLASAAHAGGLYLSEFGQPAQGASNAGAGAIQDDASTAFQNPAGIMAMDQGSEWMVTGLVIAPSIKFQQEGPGTDTTVPARNGSFPGGNGGDAGETAIGGALFYTNRFSEKFGFGFAINSISGALMEYDQPQDFVGRYWATKVDLLTINAVPSFAYRVSDRWSVAVGVPIMFGRMDMDVAIPGPVNPPALQTGPPVPYVTDGKAEIKDGNDVSANIALSALWEITERVNLGFLYAAENKLKFSSDVNLTLPAGVPGPQDVKVDVEIPFPQLASLWLSRKLGDNATILGTVRWEDWSTFDNLLISTPGGTQAIPRNWKDTWAFQLGLKWETNGAWTWYTGAGYDSSPTRAADRTADMPMDKQIRLSGGLTYEFPSGRQLGGVLTYADYGDGEIDNGGARPVTGNPWDVKGKYSTNRIIFLGINWAWGKGRAK